MKSIRKMLLLFLVLLLIPMMTACGDDDDDKNEKESAGFTVKRDENTPKGVVKSALNYSDTLENAMEDVTSTFLMFSNEKALKKLDMYDEDDEDDKVSTSWKITKSEEYDKDADVTAGVKAYVNMMAGDSSAIEQTALVEVTQVITVGDDEEQVKTYYTLGKVGGTWYLLSGNGIKKSSIDEAVEYWADKAGR